VPAKAPTDTGLNGSPVTSRLSDPAAKPVGISVTELAVAIDPPHKAAAATSASRTRRTKDRIFIALPRLIVDGCAIVLARQHATLRQSNRRALRLLDIFNN
jgi:hypothetical protein